MQKNRSNNRQLSLLAVYAHPDDESFVPGGTIAKYAHEGIEITLVCATRGEAGMAGDPPVCDRKSLGEFRTGELASSCQVLGINRLCCWDFADSKLNTYAHQDVERRIAEVIRLVKPQVVITFGPEGITGHPDHTAISHFATDAFFAAGDADKYPELIGGELEVHQPIKLYYSVLPKRIAEALTHKLQGVEDDQITATIDVSHFSHVKNDALFCHHTQQPDFRKFSDRDLGELAA